MLKCLLLSTARSPVYSHISMTLQGLSTIRALKKEDIALKFFHKYQNEHTQVGIVILALTWSFNGCCIHIGLVSLSDNHPLVWDENWYHQLRIPDSCCFCIHTTFKRYVLSYLHPVWFGWYTKLCLSNLRARCCSGGSGTNLHLLADRHAAVYSETECRSGKHCKTENLCTSW